MKPSERLRNLYREIIKNVQHVETDLEIIKEDLREASLAYGAFFCEYEVFKNIYRLEARAAERTGQSVFLLLLTVTDTQGQIPAIKLLNNSMDRLRDCLLHSLRRNDVVSRFSATQFVVMLSSLTFENSLMVQHSRPFQAGKSPDRRADSSQAAANGPHLHAGTFLTGPANKNFQSLLKSRLFFLICDRFMTGIFYTGAIPIRKEGFFESIRHCSAIRQHYQNADLCGQRPRRRTVRFFIQSIYA